MREGWKCPVCGRGVSPDEKDCQHGGGEFKMYQPIWVVPSVFPTPWPAPWTPCDPPYWVTCGDNTCRTTADMVQ